MKRLAVVVALVAVIGAGSAIAYRAAHREPNHPVWEANWAIGAGLVLKGGHVDFDAKTGVARLRFTPFHPGRVFVVKCPHNEISATCLIPGGGQVRLAKDDGSWGIDVAN